MQLVIISGRSGSGKSTALNQLEDMGYYCVDNLPAALLPQLKVEIATEQYADFEGIAVCIDARNRANDLTTMLADLDKLSGNTPVRIVFLDAADHSLIKRFSETRRKHPLSNSERSLSEAIAFERTILEPLAAAADITIDTTTLNLYDLRGLIAEHLTGLLEPDLALLIESFGFKRGVPTNADLLFDARFLPNPHWVPHLRKHTGKSPAVAEFLQQHPETDTFIAEIAGFLGKWLPFYQQSQRAYVTVGIGCTGGQHRSVYIAERLASALGTAYPKLQLRHRDINENVSL